MGKYFEHSDILPVIIRLIQENYVRRPDYVERADLIRAFLADKEGRAVAENAWRRYETENSYVPRSKWRFKSKDYLVGNMLDWFSAEYDKGNSDLTARFVRIKMRGNWAYQPSNGAKENSYLMSNSTMRTRNPISSTEADQPLIKDVIASPVIVRETTFGLERDLQAALRHNISQLEVGLKIIDGGRELSTEAGRPDVVAEDISGAVVVIELKAGTADADAITQLLSYMAALTEKLQKPIRGILVAGNFTPRLVYAARAIPNIELRKYSFNFSFETIK